MQLIFDVMLILLIALTYSGLLFAEQSGVYKFKIKSFLKFGLFILVLFLNIVMYLLYGIDQRSKGYIDAMEDTNLNLDKANKRANKILQMCDSIDMFNEQLIK